MNKKIAKIIAKPRFFLKGWAGVYGEKCHKFRKPGFSLIEVLIAILILLFGIMAIAVLMVNNIKNLQTSKNQIQAAMLAQEGIELVRNMKDSGDLNSDAPGVCEYTGRLADTVLCDDLRIDKDNDLNKGSGRQLYLDANNFYVHNNTGTSATKFFRKIDLSISEEYVASDSKREIKVTSFVSWNDAGIPTPADCNIGNKCIFIESRMPDQRQ